LLLVLAVAACAGGEAPPTGETSADEGSTLSMDEAPDPTTETSDATTEPATSSTAGPGSESGSGSGADCMDSAECTAAEYCDFADDSCGVSGVSGTCAPILEGCTADDRPVCACGDTLHDNICAASAAGVDVAFLGECPLADPLAFRCGYGFCISGDEYCLAQAGTMPSAECIPLPPVCDPADCSCITNCCDCDNATCCSQYCINDDGDLTYTCP
jgi:hypothetical protein